jgi:hypothetical protein
MGKQGFFRFDKNLLCFAEPEQGVPGQRDQGGAGAGEQAGGCTPAQRQQGGLQL